MMVQLEAPSVVSSSKSSCSAPSMVLAMSLYMWQRYDKYFYVGIGRCIMTIKCGKEIV